MILFNRINEKITLKIISHILKKETKEKQFKTHHACTVVVSVRVRQFFQIFTVN